MVKLVILNQVIRRIINFNTYQTEPYLINTDKGNSKFTAIKKLRTNEIQRVPSNIRSCIIRLPFTIKEYSNHNLY